MKRNNKITKIRISSKQKIIPVNVKSAYNTASLVSNGSLIIKGGLNISNPDILNKEKADHCNDKKKYVEKSLPGTIGFSKFKNIDNNA